MQLPLCKNQIMQRMRFYCLLCEVLGTGYAPPLYPLSSFLCGVCVYTRINFCLWTVRPPSVYGQRVGTFVLCCHATTYWTLSCAHERAINLTRTNHMFIHGLNMISHNTYDHAMYDMNLCWCDLMSSCSFNIRANARFEDLCLFGILIQACGGREGSSLTSFAMPIWFLDAPAWFLASTWPDCLQFTTDLWDSFSISAVLIFYVLWFGICDSFCIYLLALAPYMDEWVLGHHSRGYLA
jgi:hypothetical protein